MFTFNRQAVLRAADAVRAWSPKSKIIVGGPHASALAKELKKAHSVFDFIVEGEGEEEMVQLLGEEPSSEMWKELLPGPALLRCDEGASVEEHDYIYLSSSRGCRGHCTFCSTPSFWRKGVRFHSVEWVLNELRFRQHEIGLDFVSFRDDSFSADKSRLLALCQAIEEADDLHLLWDCQARAAEIDKEITEALAKAGCRTVQLGVEHGSPPMRKLLGKNDYPMASVTATKLLRKAGIEVSWFLITAIPDETKADRAATRQLIKNGKPHDVVLSPLALYPGTALYRWFAKKKKLPKNFWLETRDHWILALPFTEGQAIMRKESHFLASCAKKHRFQTNELKEAWSSLGKPWPLTWALSTHLIEKGQFKKAKEILEESEKQKSHFWLARLLAERDLWE